MVIVTHGDSLTSSSNNDSWPFSHPVEQTGPESEKMFGDDDEQRQLRPDVLDGQLVLTKFVDVDAAADVDEPLPVGRRLGRHGYAY